MFDNAVETDKYRTRVGQRSFLSKISLSLHQPSRRILDRFSVAGAKCERA